MAYMLPPSHPSPPMFPNLTSLARDREIVQERERERCAKIAETASLGYQNYCALEPQNPISLLAWIAKRIREGKEFSSCNF